MKDLECGCCGAGMRGWQHADRDNGYGICRRCKPHYGYHTEDLRIISGGQTGADRAGLDAGLEADYEIGGNCPSGRQAEDGQIAKKYRLTELGSSDYRVRTETNVLQACATVVFTEGKATGGSALTLSFARKNSKPVLHLDTKKKTTLEMAKKLEAWVEENQVQTLNVAGQRQSKTESMYEDTRQVMLKLFDLMKNEDWL